MVCPLYWTSHSPGGRDQQRLSLQMNIWKIIYLNCGERYDFMIDHRSYTHNLSSCEIKAWKKNSGLNGIRNPWPLRYRCSALTTKLSSHLGAGHSIQVLLAEGHYTLYIASPQVKNIVSCDRFEPIKSEL